MEMKKTASSWCCEKSGLAKKTTKLQTPFFECIAARVQDDSDIEAGFQVGLAKAPRFADQASCKISRYSRRK